MAMLYQFWYKTIFLLKAPPCLVFGVHKTCLSSISGGCFLCHWHVLIIRKSMDSSNGIPYLGLIHQEPFTCLWKYQNIFKWSPRVQYMCRLVGALTNVMLRKYTFHRARMFLTNQKLRSWPSSISCHWNAVSFAESKLRIVGHVIITQCIHDL